MSTQRCVCQSLAGGLLVACAFLVTGIPQRDILRFLVALPVVITGFYLVSEGIISLLFDPRPMLVNTNCRACGRRDCEHEELVREGLI